jgi:hypothetical protein
MKTNVELELISKVRELCENMQDLADFWQSNLETLGNINERKDYPFSESLQDLELKAFEWFLTLFNAYYGTNF